MAPLVYLIAGEPSGDALGAQLIAGLKELTNGEVCVAGVGGPQMTAEGLDSLYPIGALSVMGLVEVVPSIPRIYGLIRRTVTDIRRRQPDVVVTIDSQTFSHWIAKKLNPSPCPIVHYVAPTVWAWKPWRAKHLARLVDRVLMLFPFEKPYFDAVGLDAVFVGHPVAGQTVPADAGTRFRDAHAMAADDVLICLLPGSRNGEITRHLPVFEQTALRLRQRYPAVKFVLPTVSHVADKVRRAVSAWHVPVTVVSGSEEEKRAALAASNVALAVSGTVSLELAAAGLPAVITYRAHPITAAIVGRMLRIPFVSLVNLIENRGIMPEFLQGDCEPGQLADAVGVLVDDVSLRDDQSTAMKSVMAKLGRGGEPPHLRAARAVLEMLPAKDD